MLLMTATRLFAEPPLPTLANVAYGTHPRQVLDFWKAPSSQPTPLLFVIHGGAWMTGDKAKPDFLQQCLDAHISIVSINYRFISDANEARVWPPVQWPLQDSARALQFVRSKAAEWNIDPKRIGASGGSAGGFSCLWLAFHPDMADPKSDDPVARQSTRLCCVLAMVPQTTLDPQLMKQWIPNMDYGQHAFALPAYADFLKDRQRLMPWIDRFSPYTLATRDDPPVYLFYDSVPALGQPQKDPCHSVNLGVTFAEHLKQVGISVELNYPNARDVKHPDLFSFLADNLKLPQVK